MKVLGWLTTPDLLAGVMAAPTAGERVRVPSQSEYVLQR